MPGDKNRDWWPIVFIGLMIALFVAPSKRTDSPAIDTVTYISQRQETTTPPGVRAGLAELRTRGINVSEIDIDVQNGAGERPLQFTAALAVAEREGVPILVAERGSTVSKFVLNPQTKADVLQVAQ